MPGIRPIEASKAAVCYVRNTSKPAKHTWVLTLRDRIAAACELGLEEIVSKRAGSCGTRRSWLKAKNPGFVRTWPHAPRRRGRPVRPS